jgi:transcriptional regulator GlxA family with amidase domain
MRANLGRDLSIDALARVAGISPFHFVRVFARQVGRTPMQQVTRLRMELADHLLTESDLPVSEVATRCGYRSVTAFSGAVRRHCGRSPRERRSRR